MNDIRTGTMSATSIPRHEPKSSRNRTVRRCLWNSIHRSSDCRMIDIRVPVSSSRWSGTGIAVTGRGPRTFRIMTSLSWLITSVKPLDTRMRQIAQPERTRSPAIGHLDIDDTKLAPGPPLDFHGSESAIDRAWRSFSFYAPPNTTNRSNYFYVFFYFFVKLRIIMSSYIQKFSTLIIEIRFLLSKSPIQFSRI